MRTRQFRILYRQFLFRIVDLEWLARQGEVSKLLGQLAALLVFLSLVFSMSVWGLGGADLPPDAFLAASWSLEHFLISSTMLAVGLFAVLSWDSTFPDQRDVLVLAPLPVRAQTLLFAKVAACATVLGLPVGTLNVFTGLAVTLSFAPADSGLLTLSRSFAAYWITMLASGSFIYCCVLGTQGLLAQLLPRQWFLRVSSFLQIGAFCLFVSVYFLQPSLATPQALGDAQNQRWLVCLPSYWFLGLFHELKGSLHPALAPLAHRAWTNLAVVLCATAVAYVLCYARTLRQIAEQPDIVARPSGTAWLPRFGNGLQTAVTQFSVRTLLRSRQHRLFLAFYLGIAFSVVIVCVEIIADQEAARTASVAAPWHHLNAPLLAASLVVMFFGVLGTRAVFALPLDLAANWVFQVTPVGGASECLQATRLALYVLAVAPVWAGSAALFLWLWPRQFAVGHLAVLGLWGVILAELCLAGFRKIPFTCSYLPGRSNVNRAFWLCVAVFIVLLSQGAILERRALERPTSYAMLLVILCIAAICARWRATTQAKQEAMRFEEEPPPAIMVLGLNRYEMPPTSSTPDLNR